MPTFRSPPLVWLALLPPSSSLAQAARARLPAISSAAVFIIRAPRKTISSLEGRAVPLGTRAPELRGRLYRRRVRPAAGPRAGTSTTTLAAPGGPPPPSRQDRYALSRLPRR